jgi:hypothetical protein
MRVDGRVLSLSALLLVLMGVVAPAVAQEVSPWRVVLYNSATRELLAVGADESTTVYDLGLPDQVYISSFDMAFNADASQVAYCAQVVNADGSASNGIVTLRDLASATNVWQVDLGPTSGCQVSQWSADGLLAVGLAHFVFGTPDPAAIQLPGWQLFLLDASSGARVASLDPSGVPAELLDVEVGARVFMPRTRALTGSAATFWLIPWGTEAGTGLPAFIWDLVTGAITPAPDAGKSGYDALPNGESIWLDIDPALPLGEPGGPLPQANVVRLRESGGEPRTIYATDAQWVLYGTRFVNGGQQVAVSMFAAFDPASQEMGQASRLVLVSRNGTSAVVGEYTSFMSAAAIPGGVAVLWAEDTGGTAPPNIYLDAFVGDTVSTLWQLVSDNMGVSWEIARTPAVVPAEGLVPFVGM